MPDFRSSSMHSGRDALEALYYGHSDRALFLRLDFCSHFSQEHPAFEVRINVDGESHTRCHALIRDGNIRQIHFWRRDEPLLVPLTTGDKLLAAFSHIFEVQMDYELLGIGADQRAELQISLWSNDLPLQIVPQQGWLKLELASELESW